MDSNDEEVIITLMDEEFDVAAMAREAMGEGKHL
jgi:hypothetical protein